MPPLKPHTFGPSSLRRAIVLQVRRLVGGTGDDTVERNRQDTGFFGPDSACWKVHGDFTSMMVGGVTALLVQMLHPGALAGVWDHTDFRGDMSGRLKRTALFIAGTTYGDRAEAQRHIDRVRAIHAKVAGALPDGAPYAADDPQLLTWVHVAEVASFLAAYLRYADPAFPAAEQDRYLRETAEIARRLGADQPPQSCAEVAAYFRAVRPQLRYDRRTREVARALLSQTPTGPLAAPAMSMVFDAAKDLLPDWAAQMHGFRLSAPRRAGVRLGVQALGRTMRWALVNSAEARARRRAEELAREAASGAGLQAESGGWSGARSPPREP
jgi:uncharacterized protein (DUF2236 family)